MKENGKVVSKSSLGMKKLKDESNARNQLAEGETVRLSSLGVFKKSMWDQDVDVKKGTVLGVIERAIKKVQYLVSKEAPGLFMMSGVDFLY